MADERSAATMLQEIEFAPHSPLEGDGFELPVPRENGYPVEPDGREALAVKVRDRIRVEVTPDHFETWDCRFQRSDQRCRELARSRVSARDA
jgi:hypothetical protein